MTDVAAFGALMNKKRDLEKQIQDEAREMFAQTSKEIFEKYGDRVGAFGWVQYTPYFNDGDPCVFGANEVCIETPEDAQNEDFDHGWEDSSQFSRYTDGYPVLKTLWVKSDDGEPQGWKPRYGDTDEWREIPNPDYDPTYGDPYTEVHRLRDLLDDDTLLEIFGDHVAIRVTPEGVEVSDYDHD